MGRFFVKEMSHILIRSTWYAQPPSVLGSARCCFTFDTRGSEIRANVRKDVTLYLGVLG